MSSSEGENLELIILGAAYGLLNITSHAQSFVTADGEFNQKASNEVWGDGWRGENKTLVVVYTYSNTYMVDIAVEGQRMHFLASPPLRILGAAYGVKCVTEKVQAFVKNRSFSVTANNATFGDGWRWKKKTLVIVYQYGDEVPIVATAIEGKKLEFQYKVIKSPESSSCRNSAILTILGAAYGPRDVTKKVQSLVNENGGLDVTANNDTFSDTWRRHKKSLVIVYRYGCNEPQVQAIQEKQGIHLAQ